MLRILAVTIVPLPHCYHKIEMVGAIFCYRQYFYPKKQCHKSVSLKKELSELV